MAFAMPPKLKAYWLSEGLARWATTPKPYTALVAALRSEGVPEHEHFGRWPGRHDGAPKGPWDHVADRHAAARR